VTASAMRGTSVEWAGVLPVNWKEARAKFMFGRVSVPPRESDGVVTAFRDGQVTLRENRRTDGFTFAIKEIGYQHVRKGELVIHSMDGFAGAIGVSESTGKCSPVCVVCEPRIGVDARFHAYVLRHMAVSGYITSLAKGIRERSTSFGWSEFKEQWLPLPSVTTQHAIADFLDRKTAAIDALIEKKQKLLALLAEKRAALINHAVTKGLSPDVPMKDSGIPWIGEIPAHWEERRLKTLFRLKHGYAFDGAEFSDSGEFVLMTPGNFHERGGFRQKSPEKYYSDTDFPSGFILEAGQLLVAMTEQAPGLLGCALFVPDEGRYLHNQRLGLVKELRTDTVSAKYLFHLLNSSRYRAEVSVTSTGSKVKHTSPEKMLVVKVWLPSLQEQRSVAVRVDRGTSRLDNIACSTRNQITRLQEYRQALITAAVTGQLDIGEAA